MPSIARRAHALLLAGGSGGGGGGESVFEADDTQAQIAELARMGANQDPSAEQSLHESIREGLSPQAQANFDLARAQYNSELRSQLQTFMNMTPDQFRLYKAPGDNPIAARAFEITRMVREAPRAM